MIGKCSKMHQNFTPDSCCNLSCKLLTDLSWPRRFYRHMRLVTDKVILSCRSTLLHPLIKKVCYKTWKIQLLALDVVYEYYNSRKTTMCFCCVQHLPVHSLSKLPRLEQIQLCVVLPIAGFIRDYSSVILKTTVLMINAILMPFLFSLCVYELYMPSLVNCRLHYTESW